MRMLMFSQQKWDLEEEEIPFSHKKKMNLKYRRKFIRQDDKEY